MNGTPKASKTGIAALVAFALPRGLLARNVKLNTQERALQLTRLLAQRQLSQKENETRLTPPYDYQL